MRQLRFFVPATIGLLTLLGFTEAASAQQEGGGRRGGGGGGGFFGGGFTLTIDKATLLASPKVREELKIKDDLAKKVDEILEAYQKESREVFAGGRGRDASQEEREKRRKESNEKSAAIRKSTDGKIAAVLDKDQLARLSEIELQQQGVDGIVSDSVVASLKIEKEQLEKIRAVITTRDEERQKLRGAGGAGGVGGPGGAGGGGGNFQEMREKGEKIRKDADEKGLAALTKDQLAAFDKLKGKPFELDRASLGRGRGGPGNRPEGGGRPGGAGGGGNSDSSKEKKRPSDDDK